jgi:hypothetical protein
MLIIPGKVTLIRVPVVPPRKLNAESMFGYTIAVKVAPYKKLNVIKKCRYGWLSLLSFPNSEKT